MKNGEKKVSVIIPCFNMEEHVGECLDSVLGQTLKDIEVICIDDGSTDSTAKIIKSYQKKDSRVILLTQENSGAGAARNAGLEVATGEFVCFMDPDDWYPESDILKTIYKKAIEQNVLICGGSFSEYNPDGTVTTEFKGPKAKYRFEDDKLMFYSDYQYDFGYHRFLYNREFLKENNINFPLYRRFQDPPFFVKAMVTAGKFYAMKKITYAYRVGNFNAMVWTEEKLHDMLNGVTDDVVFSNEYELPELHASSVNRLTFYFTGVFLNNLDICPASLEDQVNKVFSAVNKNLVKESDYKKFYEACKNLLATKGYVLKESELENAGSDELNFKALCPPVKTSFKDTFVDFKVSVIIPVYKVEKYMGACLASVVDQTLKEIEILCVDDGTPDRSCEIIEKYMENDSRIRLIHKENGGLSSARNAGMKVAKGKYIVFLDSDDYLEPDSLEILYNRSEKDNLEVCDYDARAFFETEQDKINNKNYINYYNRNADYPKIYTGMNYFSEMQMNKDVKPAAWLHMISREFYENNDLYFYDGIIHEDNEFTYNLFKKAKRVGYVQKVFYNRRVHGDSIMTVAKTTKNAYGYFVTFAEMLKDVMNKNIESSDCEMLEYWMRSLCNNIFDIYTKLEDKNMDSFFEKDPELKVIFNVIFDEMNNRLQKECKKIEKNQKNNSSSLDKINRSARIDIKDCGVASNTIEVISKSVSEDFAEPKWMSNNTGKGRYVQTENPVCDFKVKCHGKGTLLLTLKGPDLKNKKGERVPVRIAYKNLVIDGKEIFSDIHTVWHDEPFIYKQKVSDGQDVTIHTEWVSEAEVAHSIIDQKELEIQNLKKDLYLKEKEFKSSKSWRVGRFITFVPRKIKKIVGKR